MYVRTKALIDSVDFYLNPRAWMMSAWRDATRVNKYFLFSFYCRSAILIFYYCNLILLLCFAALKHLFDLWKGSVVDGDNNSTAGDRKIFKKINKSNHHTD